MYLGLNAQKGSRFVCKGQELLHFLSQGSESEKVKQTRFNGVQVIAVNGRLDKLLKKKKSHAA